MTKPIGKFMEGEVFSDGSWRITTTKPPYHGLGIIQFYPRWKQYEFRATAGASFTWDCLKALADHLAALNAEWKAQHGATA